MPELDHAGREEFIRHFPVSHETLSKLDRYAELLAEWNQKFNLIAESTLPQIWRRHFLDSAQLIKFVPEEAKTIADLGSGAGFPGIVLSIISAHEVHLIESIGKKADFLSAVVSELKLNSVVRKIRVESLYNTQFDIITARALKPLPQLLKLSKPLMKKDSLCLFLKGQSVEVELTESRKYWKFDAETIPSLSDPSGRVLKIRNLQLSGKWQKR